jgi:hypothetical protein
MPPLTSDWNARVRPLTSPANNGSNTSATSPLSFAAGSPSHPEGQGTDGRVQKPAVAVALARSPAVDQHMDDGKTLHAA